MNRKSAEIVDDAKNKKNGFKEYSPWLDILHPINCRLDALHGLDEGLLHRIMNDFISASTQKNMDIVYTTSKYPSESPLLPRSLLEYGRYNGGDKRAVSQILL